MKIEDYIRQEQEIPDDVEITFVEFEASPSHVWSEYTSEDFSATIKYRLSNINYVDEHDSSRLHLDEDDVCKFLNTMFPSKQQTS